MTKIITAHEITEVAKYDLPRMGYTNPTLYDFEIDEATNTACVSFEYEIPNINRTAESKFGAHYDHDGELVIEPIGLSKMRESLVLETVVEHGVARFQPKWVADDRF